METSNVHNIGREQNSGNVLGGQTKQRQSIERSADWSLKPSDSCHRSQFGREAYLNPSVLHRAENLVMGISGLVFQSDNGTRGTRRPGPTCGVKPAHGSELREEDDDARTLLGYLCRH